MSAPDETVAEVLGAVPLDELERLLTRAALLRSFRAFVGWSWPLITGAAYVPNPISERIIETLQRVGDGELIRVLIACPPGVGKTSLLACYSGWRRARDAAHRSIHGSHSFDLSSTESRRVRRFVEGDEYRRMFPTVELRVDESTVGLWATTAGGAYIAVGVGGGLTGRRAIEAVVDDVLNAADRFSKAARDACFVWFTEALSTRLDTDRAPIVVVMQRLDRDDLIGRLVEQGGWFLLELPAEDEHGEPIAPSILSREKLDALKAQIGAAAFAAQYQQRPSDDNHASIKRVWWRFHRTAQVAVTTPRPSGCDTTIAAVDTPTRFDRLVISADLTFGGLKASNDFAAITVWGRAGVGRYLLAIWWRRTTQLAQRDAIKALKREYPSAKILVEKAAAGAGVLELLAADGIDALPITPLGSKAERLDLVSPAIESGSVYLPLGAPWLGAFVEELAGATRHDDAQDSTAMALAELATGAPARDLKRESAGWYRVLNAINGNPTVAELELAAAKRVDAMAAKATEVEREQAEARKKLKKYKKNGRWQQAPLSPTKPPDTEDKP